VPVPGQPAPGTPPPGAPGSAAVDNYTARLVKYIPVEIVGAYLAIDNLARIQEPVNITLLWVTFAVLMVLTPLYLFKIEKVRKPNQLLLSTGSFVVWVLALPGPFVGLVDPIYSATALILYTVAIPVIEV